jgi:hypothetical protein
LNDDDETIFFNIDDAVVVAVIVPMASRGIFLSQVPKEAETKQAPSIV